MNAPEIKISINGLSELESELKILDELIKKTQEQIKKVNNLKIELDVTSS